MSRKRPREEGWWQRTVNWVQSHPGGKVHPGVKLSDQRELIVDQALEEGTELLKIPFPCLVSNVTIKSTPFGQQIVDSIQKVEPGDLSSPVQDLAVALYLAKYPDTESLTDAKEDTKFRPYLDTLPERSSYDSLPRLWPDNGLKFLQGSPLLKRVQNQKSGIKKDYDLVHQKFKEGGQEEELFPAFEDFSYRLAAVSSRAFAGFGSLMEPDTKPSDDDMNIAMVPLLDLCNHCRGAAGTKNLSYKRHVLESEVAAVILVTASQQIKAGENLRITYGARSNAQLLLNYGFCIPDNIEPDGSSNDFLEFIVDSKDNKKTVELRAGPKAHSFHGFVNALDSFMAPSLKGQQKEGDDEQEGHDFEANEKEFDRWDMDMMGDMNGDDEEDEEGDDDEDTIQQEKEQSVARYLASLKLLESRLKIVWDVYPLKGKELHDALTSSDVNQRNAALLIQSEHRTLFFVLCVIRRLRQELLTMLGSKAEQEEGSSSGDDESLIVLTTADKDLLLEQANEVSSAFLAIRLRSY